MRPRQLVPSLLLFLLLITAIGCDQELYFQKNIPLPEASWDYSDTLSFEFVIQDTSNLYDLFLDLDHSSTFSFQNLYVKIGTHFPDGHSEEKVVSLEMADKMGFWYGECTDDWCELTIPLQTGVYFNQSGAYRLTINQHIRTNPVNGIRTVSFRIAGTGGSR